MAFGSLFQGLSLPLLSKTLHGLCMYISPVSRMKPNITSVLDCFGLSEVFRCYLHCSVIYQPSQKEAADTLSTYIIIILSQMSCKIHARCEISGEQNAFPLWTFISYHQLSSAISVLTIYCILLHHLEQHSWNGNPQTHLLWTNKNIEETLLDLLLLVWLLLLLLLWLLFSFLCVLLCFAMQSEMCHFSWVQSHLAITSLIIVCVCACVIQVQPALW